MSTGKCQNLNQCTGSLFLHGSRTETISNAKDSHDFSKKENVIGMKNLFAMSAVKPFGKLLSSDSSPFSRPLIRFFAINFRSSCDPNTQFIGNIGDLQCCA